MKNKESLIDNEHMNWAVVETYLRKHINEIPDEQMDVEKFTEGYSNLTYLLKFGDWEAILRRPPFGKTPPRAHDMKREYNILSNLNPFFSYAPKPYLYCDNREIMDKHFYVMERKNGYVIDDIIPNAYGKSNEVGPIISKNMVETLVELQAINYIDAGLGNFGKPEGYLERQVNGWIKRYELSKTDNYEIVKELEGGYQKSLPIQSEVSIVHNDFKINNVVFDRDHVGSVVGVLDWELSTIGDPLTDFGSMVAYWGEAGDPDMGIHIVTDQDGFFSRRELVEAYANKSGRTTKRINFYVSFGFYKLAVILQQIFYRWSIGELKDDRFQNLNEAIHNLFEMAHLTMKNKII